MSIATFVQNKKFLIGIAALVLALALYGGFLAYEKYQRNVTIPTTTELLHDEALDFSFRYPVGDGGLSLIEPPVNEQAFLKAYLLMPSAEYVQFQKNPAAGESPAVISVFVYELPDDTASSTEDRPNRITRMQNWARDNSVITSFNTAKATPDIVEIDGVKALHYQADGLYQQDIYLASYKGHVYMFAAQYNQESDVTYRAFSDVIASVSFD